MEQENCFQKKEFENDHYKLIDSGIVDVHVIKTEWKKRY